MKIVIVGGVAGGMSAATRLRRLMEDAEIIIFEKGPYVSFANCGLPYYVSGEIADRESLLLQTPESLKARFNLDVRVESEVTGIDPEAKLVNIQSGDQNYQESYDKLILSPGAKPFVPAMEGLDEANNVYTLRNVPDLDRIMTALEGQSIRQATVIGAGFIGLEMVENLRLRGIEVTLVEQAPHVLPPLDQEMAAFVEEELVKQGIRVITGQSAQSFQDQGQTIVLSDGHRLNSDLTILSVGVKPENSLAEDAGLALGIFGGIQVNEQYETSHEDIYAVGDAIIVNQPIDDSETMIALASPANRQGRQVADVIAGMDRKNRGSIGTSIVRVFDITAASTGFSERQARMKDLAIQVVHTVSKDHAGYYPGATDVHLKLIYDTKTGRILGAQGVGVKGVDKRIDVLSTAIKAEMTIEDLPELELTYAPPFGSAKDAVNIIGYVALNIWEGLSETVQPQEVAELVASGAQVIDTRGPAEVKRGHLKDESVLNIPLDDLRDHLDELDQNKDYLLLCQSGTRSYIGERVMKQAGFNAKNIDGGYNIYAKAVPEEVTNE